MAENSEYQAPIENATQVITGNTPGENVAGNSDSYTRFQIEEILKTVRTGMPGIVQSSFERDGSVWLKVQPALSVEMRKELGGDEVQLPVVIAPLGVIDVAGFVINLPTPVHGDEVWIICADRNLGSFTKQGGVGVPATNSVLSLNNAYCLPFSTSNVKRKRVGEATDLTITGKDKKTKITVASGGDITVSTLTGTLTLATADAALWKPNILPACLFTGAPHGGESAGITKLKGRTAS
jgi:hypothetical protein